MVYTTFGIWSMIQHWTLALGLPKHDLDRPLPGPLFRDTILYIQLCFIVDTSITSPPPPGMSFRSIISPLSVDQNATDEGIIKRFS